MNSKKPYPKLVAFYVGVFTVLSFIGLTGASYGVFSPGGALSGTWNSQTVNLGASAFITGTLPAANVAAGGATTQIQYNNAGVLAGDDGNTWDATNNIEYVGSAIQPGSISGFNATSSGNGVGLTLRGGTALTSGSGGTISLRGGSSAGTTAQLGGAVSIVGGIPGTQSTGGSALISGGPGGTTSGNGGSVTVQGSTAIVDGNGGNVLLTATNGTGTNRDGGLIIMQTGTATGSGALGTLQFVNMTATGAQLATFSATNKPGTATGAPTLWLRTVVAGTTYWIPMFAN